jgi:hypothetical protein
MSVNNRRFAAAKRTAAPTRGSRSRLKLAFTWLTVATALSFFTFTVAATAANSKPDYAGAAKGLRADQPRIVVTSSGKHEVCSVNEAQLARLDAEYEVGWMTVTIDGSPADLVTVTGANDGQMRAMLGDHVKCTLVKEQHVFYLPFDAQTS